MNISIPGSAGTATALAAGAIGYAAGMGNNTPTEIRLYLVLLAFSFGIFTIVIEWQAIKHKEKQGQRNSKEEA